MIVLINSLKLIACLLLLIPRTTLLAQVNNATYIKQYSFMEKLPQDFTYYKDAYNETKTIIEDPTIIWTAKEHAYWRFLIANIALFATDSIIKEIWADAYENSPYAICDFYSYIFEAPFNAKYFSRAPVGYFYLHNEKPYFDSICQSLNSSYDPDLITKFREIIVDDNGRGKRELTPLQASKDSINQIKVATIIKKLGTYPGRSKVGTLSEVAWLVIQHAPPSYQQKYLPYVQQAVDAKDLNPKYLAYLIDRINMSKDIPQIYGTQYVKKDDKNVFYPISDLNSIDDRRKSVGLEPLEQYMSASKISLD